MTLTQRILNRILTAITWKPVLTLCTAFLLAGLSIYYTITQLGFQTGQRDLISPSERLIQLAAKVDQFNDLDSFIVVIENRDNSRSIDYLRALAARIEADKKSYSQIYYRIDPDKLKKWALLYPDQEDLLTLRNNLQEHQDFIKQLAQQANLNNFYQLLNNEIASAMVGELFTGFLKDDSPDAKEQPFDLTFLLNSLQGMNRALQGKPFKSPWGSLFTKESWDEEMEGYFWTENKRYLLLFVTPQEVETDGFIKAQASLERLRHTVAEMRNDFPDIQAGVTGHEALNMDEMASSFRDMSVATIVSLVGLTLLLVLFWRGIRRPLFEMIELVIALSLTFGLTTFFIGHLNILSIVFAPLLLGLGIDYGIHWLSRYQEEVKNTSLSRKDAIRKTVVELGPGIVLAGFTAALSFFPLVLTGFKGLVELGIISSMGMVMTTITTTCVLPTLVLLFDKPKVDGRKTCCENRPLFRLTDGRAISILGISAMGLVVSLIFATGVKFDLNMLNLQSQNAESVIWERKLLADSNHSSTFGAVLANSLAEVESKSKMLQALPTVSKVQSVLTILPENQPEKVPILRQLKPLLPDPRGFHATGGPVDIQGLDQSLSRIRFKMLDSSKTEWGARSPVEEQMMQARDLIGQIRDRLNSMDESKVQSYLTKYDNDLMEDLNNKLDLIQTNASTSPMQIGDLPRDILKRFIGGDGVYLIRVFPAVNVWEPEHLGKFVRDLRSVDADAVGDPVTLYVFTRAFRDACITASIYAVVFIGFLLVFTFRSLPAMLLAMLPLLVGTAWTMGLMRLLGVNLNLANSLFLPLIVGAGVEYGIIILQRWRQRRSGDVELPLSTGKGIILAGLTTTVGFGSLTIAAHRGIHSLGLLATLGSLSVVAAAVIFLPAALRLESMVCRKLARRSLSFATKQIKEKCVTLKEEQI